MFDFDTLILGSLIYQQAERSHLRQAIGAGNDHKAIPPMEPIAHDDANTSILIRGETTGRNANERREGEPDDNGNDELVPTGGLDQQSPVVQNTHEKPAEPSNKQGTTALVTISSSKSA